MNITRTSYAIDTIMPDGSVLSAFTPGTSPAAYAMATIAETKQLTVLYTLQAGENFLGKTLYITGGTLNIGNAYPSGTPASGYKFTVTGSAANAVAYNMQYIGCSNNGAQNEFFKVTVTFADLGQTVTPQTVIVKVQQIIGYDIENYRACDFYENQSRLLKSLVGEAGTVPVIANTNSFFNNTQKVLAHVLHVTDGTATPFRDELQVPLQAGWYNKGALDAAPYFSLASPVELSVSGNTVTGISPVKYTKVLLSNICPVQPDKCIAILIDTTDNDQTKTWWENYDYSAAEIVTNAVVANPLPGYNSKMVSISQAPTDNGFGVYETFFHIDYNLITAGRKYRIIWILYNIDLYYAIDDNVNSFISDEFTAGYYEPFDGQEFDLTGKFSDYQKIFLGNDLEVVPEERIKAILDIDYMDGVNNTLYDRLLARFGQEVTDNPYDIRSMLKQVQIVFSWEETIAGKLYKHVVDDVKIIRTGLNTYLLPKGTEFISIGTSTSIPDFEAAVRLGYTFRVRYEDDILNIRSYIDGVLQLLPLATQNWIGKTILIDWTLTLEYDEISPIQQDTIRFQHQIRPKDYENNRDQPDRNLDFLDITDELQVLCDDDEFCPVSTKINLVDEYRHIVNLDRESFKVQNIEEEETWVGVLPQLATDKLNEVDSDYVDETADACVDLVLLDKNKTYKFAAIAKKLKDPACVVLIYEKDDIVDATIRIRLQIVTGTLTIDWGQGTTQTVTASTAIQTFLGPHTNIGVYTITICGNCENISHFDADTIVGGVSPIHDWILAADLTRLESDLGAFLTLSVSSSHLVDTDLYLPVTAQNYSLVRFRGFDSPNLPTAPFNTVATALNFSNMSGNFTSFEATQMRALNSLTFNPATKILTSFILHNTALNQVFDFGTQIFASIIQYRCAGITSALTQANLDANIDNIYQNRVAYNVQQTGSKSFSAAGTNPAPSGTLVAPAGYIQADAVTVGNDGTPANAKEQIYVLVNQNNDNTVVKKYQWTFTVN